MLRNFFCKHNAKKTLFQELSAFIDRADALRDQSTSMLERAIYDAHHPQKQVAMKMLEDLGGIEVIYLRADFIAAREGEVGEILHRHADTLPEQYSQQRSMVSDAELDLFNTVLKSVSSPQVRLP